MLDEGCKKDEILIELGDDVCSLRLHHGHGAPSEKAACAKMRVNAVTTDPPHAQVLLQMTGTITKSRLNLKA